jgi:cytochrome c-type biogenesis protein CcmH
MDKWLFALLALALCAGSAAVLTRPLWQQRSMALTAALGLFMLIVAGAGYAMLGTPAALTHTPPPGAAMLVRLAERLQARPDDAQGWQVMARAHAGQGHFVQAIAAFRQASRLRPRDASLHAEHAAALAALNGGRYDGEPAQLIEQALSVDPKHARALAMAGALAYERQDWRCAISHWERLAEVEPTNSPLAAQIRASLALARLRAQSSSPTQ